MPKAKTLTQILVVGSLVGAFIVYGIGTSVIVPLESAKEDSRYKETIGSTYRLKEEFSILGITHDLNKKQLNHYTIYPNSSIGFSGPEVISRGILHKGAVFELTDVFVSRWEIVAPRTEYILSTVAGVDSKYEKVIRVSEGWFNSEYFELVSR